MLFLIPAQGDCKPMKQEIKVSVLIPAYNVETYIDSCLESVMNQTMREIEIIVTDDGSSDATLSHLECAAERDDRIRIIRHEINRGIFQSRKDAVLVSCGSYIMFADSDDWLELDACERAYTKAKKDGVDVLQFGAVVENCGNLSQHMIEIRQAPLKPYLGPTLTEPLSAACFLDKRFGIFLWGKLFRGDIVRSVCANLPDETVNFTEDAYLSFFLMRRCRSYAGMEETLYHYCYGRGMCGHTFLPSKGFQRYCECTRVYNLLDRFVAEEENTSPSDENRSAQVELDRKVVSALKLRFANTLLNTWLNTTKPEDKADAFLTMESAWGMGGPAFVGLIAQIAWDRRKAVAESLQDADYLKFKGRPIRTIALYYNRLNNGGAERVTAILANSLAEIREESGDLRYRIVLVTEEDAREEDYPLSPLVMRERIPARLESLSGNYPSRAKAWEKIITSHGVDAVIYSQWAIQHMLWDLLSIKRTERNPAFLIYVHGWCAVMYQEYPNRLEQREQVYHLADGVVALSEADRLYWSRHNLNTRLIPNPCFIKASQAKRASFGKHILWIGRLSAEKQPLEIPRIMREVTELDPEIVCHVVGADKPKIRTNLEEGIAAQALEGRVIVEGFHQDVTSFYENCSLLLMTSRFEASPLTLQEAAACGMPTVMYELPWLFYCSDMKGWISVPQLDARAAAEAIVRLVNNPSEWQSHSDSLYRSALAYENRSFVGRWQSMLSDLEQGRIPEAPQLDAMTGLFLDQIGYHHGIALRNLIFERDTRQKRIVELEKALEVAHGAEKTTRANEQKAREAEKKALAGEQEAREAERKARAGEREAREAERKARAGEQEAREAERKAQANEQKAREAEKSARASEQNAREAEQKLRKRIQDIESSRAFRLARTLSAPYHELKKPKRRCGEDQ